MLADGGFDTGTGWSGNAFNIVDGVSRANVEAAGKPWDVNLSGDVTLVPGELYTVQFQAKGTEGRTILAGIGDTSEPYANNTEILTLSPEWQTFTLHLDANGLKGGAGRVMFDMGADVGEVDIDQVSVVAGHVGTESLNHPAINLLSDGGLTPRTDGAGTRLILSMA